MSTNNKYASPYLLRPPRSHEEIMRERTNRARGRSRCAEPENADAGLPARGSKRCDATAAPLV